MPAANPNPLSQAAGLPALTGVPALAAATAGSTGASTNFLQLLAQLIGNGVTTADPNPEAELLLNAGAPAEQSEDTDTTTTDDPATEESELLSMLAMVPGLCPAPPQVAVAQSTATQLSDTASKEILAALPQASGDPAAGSGTATSSDATALPLPQVLSDPILKAGDAATAPPSMPGQPSGGTSALLDKLNQAIDGSASVTLVDSNSSVQPSHLHTMSVHARPNVEMPQTELRSPVGTPAWHDELGNQLTWMAQNGREAASLRLSPEHLGPVEIRISVNDGQASVWFGAANADTRSALDQSLPRLREMFASQGMMLSDAGVFKEAPRQQSKAASFSASNRIANEAGEPAQAAQVSLARLRLVDTYV
jgi:flagellar hook-length control protein FliK